MRASDNCSHVRISLVVAAVFTLLCSCRGLIEPSGREPATRTVEMPVATNSALPTASTELDAVESTATPAATTPALPTATFGADLEELTETPSTTAATLPTASPEPEQEEASLSLGFALLYQAGREQKEIYEFTFSGRRLVTPGDLVGGQPFSPDRQRAVIVMNSSSQEEGIVSSNGILDLESGVIEQLNLLGTSSRVFWSPDGKQLIYLQEIDDVGRLVIYDFETQENKVIVEDQSVWRNAGWSYDGRMVAFVSNTDDRYDVHIIDMDSLEVRRITDTIDIEPAVIWSPIADVLLIGETAFGPQRFEGWPFSVDNIYLMDLEGNKTDLGNYGRVSSGSLAWSTDGSSIAYSEAGNMCVLRLATGQKTCPWESLTPYSDYYAAFEEPPVWSPDDEWLAFRATGYEKIRERISNCQGVYIIELATNQPIVVEEGSCKFGPVYWLENSSY